MNPVKQGLDLGLIVTELEPMVAFYRDVLGLVELGRRENGWGSMVELGFGDSVIRLLQPQQPPTRSDAELLGRTGVRYLTFPVTDFDQVAARLADHGAPLVLPLTEVGAVRFMMYADPEGNAVELFARAEEGA